jgi:hypothetical protein
MTHPGSLTVGEQWLDLPGLGIDYVPGQPRTIGVNRKTARPNRNGTKTKRSAKVASRSYAGISTLGGKVL